MSQSITITITVPEGSAVEIEEAPDLEVDSELIKRFFEHYLSDNGRTVFLAAARCERQADQSFSFEDIAREAGIAYETAKSYHRNSGRSARRWRDDTRSEAPVRLLEKGYDWDADRRGMRATYRLPKGVAEVLTKD
jgi:hypothetical protein